MACADQLLIFARGLQAGKVKTRLIPAYGADGALAIYRHLLQRTCDAAVTFPGQVTLWADQPDPALARLAADRGWGLSIQCGDNLGERMSHALHQSLQVSHKVLLVGSDCPVLDQGYFEQALTALDTNKVVFGASEDGGYVLLGSSSAGLWNPQPFKGVQWGSQYALQQSREAFSEVKQCVLPPLWDVDLPDDVSRACELRLLPATFLSQAGGRQ